MYLQNTGKRSCSKAVVEVLNFCNWNCCERCCVSKRRSTKFHHERTQSNVAVQYMYTNLYQNYSIWRVIWLVGNSRDRAIKTSCLSSNKYRIPFLPSKPRDFSFPWYEIILPILPYLKFKVKYKNFKISKKLLYVYW